MTFKNIERTMRQTIVFFPACLGGSLDNALRKENITGWRILSPAQAKQELGITEIPEINLYEDIPSPTRNIRVLVSNFDENQITHAIYKLHDDPEAMKYRDEQSALVEKALHDDGVI